MTPDEFWRLAMGGAAMQLGPLLRKGTNWAWEKIPAKYRFNRGPFWLLRRRPDGTWQSTN